MKKGVTTVLTAVATVLLCSVSMFGQAAQSAPQSGPGSEGAAQLYQQQGCRVASRKPACEPQEPHGAEYDSYG